MFLEKVAGRSAGTLVYFAASATSSNNCFATSSFELVIIFGYSVRSCCAVYPGVIVGHARRQRSPQNAAPAAAAAVDLNFTLMQRVKSGPVW